jgi:hypothetical protein
MPPRPPWPAPPGSAAGPTEAAGSCERAGRAARRAERRVRAGRRELAAAQGLEAIAQLSAIDGRGVAAHRHHVRATARREAGRQQACRRVLLVDLGDAVRACLLRLLHAQRGEATRALSAVACRLSPSATAAART